jgi:hypothetical protein
MPVWNVFNSFTSKMAETTPNIPGTAFTPDCTKPPNPRLETEPNGMVRVTVGDQIGWVSSYHLADTKVRQLRHAWLKEHKTD